MSIVFDDNINEIIDDVNIIEDNNFMTKDVSELVKGDYYLFHVERLEDNFKSYYWKDGVLFCSDSSGALLINEEYTKGTLQECVDSLGE